MTIRLCLLTVLLGTLVLAAGCGGSASQAATNDPNARPGYSSSDFAAPGRYGGTYRAGTASGDTEAGARFAQWVLDQDPQQQYITDAVVRNEQSLGVKVQPTVRKGDLQDMLVSLAQGMARTFPGKAIQVIAFYQSGDKLAEAYYDPRTGQVSIQ